MTIKIQLMTVRRAEAYLCKDEDTKESVLLIAVQEGVVVCDGGISNDSKDFWSFLNEQPIFHPVLVDIDDEHISESAGKLIDQSRMQSTNLDRWIRRNYNEATKSQVEQNFPYNGSEPPF